MSPAPQKRIAFKIPFNIPINSDTQWVNENAKAVIMNPEWIAHRIHIFMQYTLPSLKNQTNQDFMAYLLYYAPSEKMLLEILGKYPLLPANIRFIREEDYNVLSEEYVKSYPFFYEVEMGSDDLYHKHFVQYLMAYEPTSPAICVLICQQGYIYSSVSMELAEYFNFSSCFNCFIYPAARYLSGIRYSYTNFAGAIRFKHEFIPWRTYINHSHQLNLAFSYEQEKGNPWGKQCAYIGKQITQPAQFKSIFLDFMGSLPQ